MHISKQHFRKLIEGFQFRELFNQLGWNNIKETLPILVNEDTFELVSVADKSGFRILVCNPDVSGNIPPHDVRFKLDKIVSRLYKEHLIIFTDKTQTKQTWQLLWSTSGKPAKIHPTEWHKGQDPEILYQKTSGLLFTLDEEEGITIVDVTQRVANNFHQNNEKVTKHFYERFKKEHTSFLSFIKGINTVTDKDWYASLMLNRLMFCYFIQKKGFLDNDMHYLRERLKQCKKKKGDGKFYSFYRSFLLVLFHKGLNEPEQKAAIETEIGKVPYLNGGLFDEHELERKNTDIDINDDAFERIFNFFDEYNWHLDTRVIASGKDINPDVIGYIFEKYINDRAQMGAYYTKEDITDYISKNCIIPWLFDETARHYPKAFAPNSEIWTALKESGSDYIYDAVKHGISNPLPPAIEAGIKEVSKRTEWNKPAPDAAALPTEIWREVIERRTRYAEAKEKIDSGAITHINDFITYNLAIRQFAQDVVAQTTDPQFLAQFYKALNRVTILDPTCGSGAFLFAAMNILEPLYDACLIRMEAFIAENGKGRHKYYEEVISNLNAPEHPNRQYFIYKSIILNNLYGVDIMREAVEIAKLRLFLKLVATVDADYTKPNLGLEPLPDIDFNIRTGNTLIGFATEKQLETGSLDYQNDKEKVQEEMELVGMAYARFKQLQLKGNQNYVEFKIAKNSLQEHLNALSKKLDHAYFNAYGDHSIKFECWKSSNIPFHWFAEFYEIIQDRKGFDVIIGNPPYVNFRKVEYKIYERDYTCFSCKDLFAITIEKGFKLISKVGRNGFIIPLSGMSTDAMTSLKEFILKSSLISWNSYYSASDQPASLFNGVRHRLLITLNSINSGEYKKFYSTNFIKWFSNERLFLFEKSINYTDVSTEIPPNSKISSELEKRILKKLNQYKPLANYVSSVGKAVFFHNAPVHWGKIFDFIPFYSVGGVQQQSSHLKCLFLPTDLDAAVTICLLNSSLFYWYNWQYSNCRDISQKDVLRMPIAIDKIGISEKEEFGVLKARLMNDLKKNSKLYKRVSDNIETEFDSFYPFYSKPIIDSIDFVLSKHFNLTDEEFDFIVNYDIKYRMGKEVDEEDTDTSKNKKDKTDDTNLLGSQIKPEPMKEFSLNEGLYFVNDVAHYTGLPEPKIRRWFRKLYNDNYEGFLNQQDSDFARLRISFYGLIELVVIDTLQDNGFTFAKIMKARTYLKQQNPSKVYPFATNNIKDDLKIAGKSLVFKFPSGDVTLDGSGQYNLSIIQEFFKNIEFDSQGLALRLFPYKNSKLIIIDPKQAGGKAAINGKGIWTEVIASIYTGADSISILKQQYEITEEEILAAVDYCN